MLRNASEDLPHAGREKGERTAEATSGWTQIWHVAVSWAQHGTLGGMSWALKTVMALDSGELCALRDSDNVHGFQEEQSPWWQGW